MTAIVVFLKSIPSWLWGLLAFLAIVAGSMWYGHHWGSESKQAQWDKSVAKGLAQVEKLKDEAGKITTKVETVYVDRIKTITQKGKEIERIKTVFVPVDSPDLPGSVRLYHDAASQNAIPDAARIPDAAPVPLADLAGTVASNYGQCNVYIAQLEGWQDWAKQQMSLNGEAK